MGNPVIRTMPFEGADGLALTGLCAIKSHCADKWCHRSHLLIQDRFTAARRADAPRNCTTPWLLYPTHRAIWFYNVFETTNRLSNHAIKHFNSNRMWLEKRLQTVIAEKIRRWHLEFDVAKCISVNQHFTNWQLHLKYRVGLVKGVNEARGLSCSHWIHFRFSLWQPALTIIFGIMPIVKFEWAMVHIHILVCCKLYSHLCWCSHKNSLTNPEATV